MIGICTSNFVSGDINLLFLASIVAIFFIIIRYIIAVVAKDENGKYEVKYMFGDFIFSLILAIILLAILNSSNKPPSENLIYLTINTSMANLVPVSTTHSIVQATNDEWVGKNIKGGVGCVAASYLKTVTASSVYMYKFLIWESTNIEILSRMSTNLNMYPPFLDMKNSLSISKYNIKLYSGISSWVNELRSSASRILTLAVFANLSQYYTLLIFSSKNMYSLLILAVALRHIPFMKGFGNVMFAVIITFTIVLPFTIYGESYIFHPPTAKQITATTDFTSDFYNFKSAVGDVYKVTKDLTYYSNLAQLNLQKEAINKFISDMGKDILSPDRSITNMFRDIINYISNSFDNVVKINYNVIFDTYLRLDENKGILYLDNKKLLDYITIKRLIAETYINAGFLATINILTIAVSIKQLQLMMGDTDSVMEMFVRWI